MTAPQGPLPRVLAELVIEAAQAAVDAVPRSDMSEEVRTRFMRTFRAAIGWPVADLTVVRGDAE